MLTDEEKRRINDALTVNNGDRALAAASLNISTVELKTVIHNNIGLKKHWSKSRKPLIPEALGESQEVAVAVTTESDEAVMERRNKDFQKLISSTGTPEELTDALNLQKAYGRFAEECESVLGGGLVDRGMKLKRLMDKVGDRITDLVKEGTPPEGFASLSILFIEGHKQLANITSVVGQSRVGRAKIQAIRESAKQQRGKGKTSFGPKQINVSANNVQLVNQ